MEQVVLVIHLMLALAIIGLVLVQRSEGGGLGIGGGGGGLGQFASARATANVLTRATAICAVCFFCTSLLLAWLAGTHTGQDGILERVDVDKAAEAPAVAGNAEEGVGAGTEQETEENVPPKPPQAPISQ